MNATNVKSSLAWWACAVACVIAALAAIGAAQDDGNERQVEVVGRLHLFVAPGDKPLGLDPDVMQALEGAGVAFIPHLLVEDRATLQVDRPDEGLLATIRALERAKGEELSLPVIDEEGLELARRVGLRETPAWVFIDAGGVAHVTCGDEAAPKEAIRCR